MTRFSPSRGTQSTPFRGVGGAARPRCVISRPARGKFVTNAARNRDENERRTTTTTTTTTPIDRLVSVAVAVAAAVVAAVSLPATTAVAQLSFPPHASARETSSLSIGVDDDDDPVSFFQLRGSVAKKYAIEEIEEGDSNKTSSASSTSDSSPSAAPSAPSPSSSSRVVKRKAGLTVAACVAEGRGPRGGELSAALASASGAASVPPPTGCGRAERASSSSSATSSSPSFLLRRPSSSSPTSDLPRACASACSGACSLAVERKDEILRKTTGFGLSDGAKRRLALSCSRACGGECVRPSTSTSSAYDFFVNFGR